MINESGTFNGMKTGRGNKCTEIKLAPVLLCSPKIPHDLIYDRNLHSLATDSVMEPG
jgi:hypothetical protein